jgi:hypothetical protein
MRWMLLKKGKQVIARAEPTDGDMMALIVMHINPGEDLFGVPYENCARAFQISCVGCLVPKPNVISPLKCHRFLSGRTP